MLPLFSVFTLLFGTSQAITHGTLSALDGAPHTVTLEVKDYTDPTGQTWAHKCNAAWLKFDVLAQVNGTIHDRYWLVTAARCFDDITAVSDWRWTIGRRSWNEIDSNIYTGSIRYIIKHPSYIPNTANGNDIALVKATGRPSETTANSRRVAVDMIYRTSDSPVGRTCVISGWGQIESSSSDSYENLPGSQYQGTATGISRTIGVTNYYNATSSLVPSDVFFTTVVSSDGDGSNDGGPYPSPCKSYDYGTPVVCQYGSSFRINGVSTQQTDAQQCGDQDLGVPPMYTSMTTHLAWIISTINAN